MHAVLYSLIKSALLEPSASFEIILLFIILNTLLHFHKAPLVIRGGMGFLMYMAISVPAAHTKVSEPGNAIYTSADSKDMKKKFLHSVLTTS